MGKRESELEMVTRHVLGGGDLLQRQLELIAKLRAAGHGTDLAEEVLALFKTAQDHHCRHLAQLMDSRRPDGDKTAEAISR
jgi:hypothetical protein